MELRLDLPGERMHALEREAERAGIDMGELIKRWVDDGLRHEVPTAPRAWMPRERWDALCRGEGCPLCALLQANSAEDAWGFTVANLRLSRLRLVRNQSVPGYAVLLCV